jgi:adenylate cyclase
VERRLAAILAADVVGYSKLMGEDEAGTLSALRQLRDDILEPAVEANSGRVVKRLGDGWLVDFQSAKDAVACAIIIQELLNSQNTIRLRIGLHVGDVTFEEEDIFGDGVNIAARLESLAEPGGITISDQVFYALDGTIRGAFCDGGDRQLRNINRNVRVWHWPEAPAIPELEEGSSQDSIPMILVEKFAHSGDVDASFDLTEELRSEIVEALSHRTGIRVATPAEGAEKPIYLLNGRCHVIEKRCRLHLTLGIAASGESFWTTKIDREITDLFDFLDDVVGKISTALRTHINAYSGAVYASQPDEELSFQQLLSKAAFYFYRHDANSVTISRKTMEAALAMAPDNPMALAMRAYAIMQTVPMAMERIEEIDADAAMSFADQSVYHGSNVDFAFRNRGRIRLWLRRDHDGCRADAKRALAINPHYHMAKEELSLADLFGGRVPLAIRQLEALQLETDIEPWHTPYRQSMLGIAYALAGDSDAAVDHAREGYEQRPLLPIHALAYAVAACKDTSLTGTADFRAMIDHHALRASDADRFPFASQKDTAAVNEMLCRSGLPD